MKKVILIATLLAVGLTAMAVQRPALKLKSPDNYVEDFGYRVVHNYFVFTEPPQQYQTPIPMTQMLCTNNETDVLSLVFPSMTFPSGSGVIWDWSPVNFVNPLNADINNSPHILDVYFQNPPDYNTHIAEWIIWTKCRNEWNWTQQHEESIYWNLTNEVEEMWEIGLEWAGANLHWWRYTIFP